MESPAQNPSNPLLRPFYPALDGLRAIAFLLVFFFHFRTGAYSPTAWRWWGWVGVDLFFVLSGFLITGILFDSLHHRDYFRNFYIRRALRIFPIFFGFWIVMLALTPLLHIAWNRYNVAMALYVGNFFIPGADLGHHLPPGILYYTSIWSQGHRRGLQIHHLWSLCVEEQFYLAWPAVLFFLRKRRSLIALCLAILITVPLLRLLYIHLWPQTLPSGPLYFNTFARMDTLIAGATLALWLRQPTPHTVFAGTGLRRIALALAIGAPLLLALLVAAETTPAINAQSDPVVSGIGYSLIALSSVGLVLLAIDPATRLSRFLQLTPLAALGRISYGLYFYHELLIEPVARLTRFLNTHHLRHMRADAIDLVLTIAISWLSFRFVESPFLRLKSRLAPRPSAIADPTPSS
jgi:peptidoglycan/LPS O-acetylase OafA/YrhL